MRLASLEDFNVNGKSKLPIRSDSYITIKSDLHSI